MATGDGATSANSATKNTAWGRHAVSNWCTRQSRSQTPASCVTISRRSNADTTRCGGTSSAGRMKVGSPRPSSGPPPRWTRCSAKSIAWLKSTPIGYNLLARYDDPTGAQSESCVSCFYLIEAVKPPVLMSQERRLSDRLTDLCIAETSQTMYLSEEKYCQSSSKHSVHQK